MALPENVLRCIMMYGSPEVAAQRERVLTQLEHNAQVRKYVRHLYLTYNVRNSSYNDLIETFFNVHECLCCPRHRRSRPVSPFDGTLFPRTYDPLTHRCKCKCRFLLRSIVDEVVSPSI